MTAYNLINIIAGACAIAAAITVGRTGLLKQTISAQAALITALEKENADHEESIREQGETITELRRRVNVLEEMFYGNPAMVGKRHLASCRGCGCGNRAAPPKTPKNRHP